ncbi:AMP-dependent synthetase, partial [Nocardia elegans]|nr:AMP-dependent synthetase [Nocardia elegans]
VSEAELVAHCRHSLARDKVPVAVRITDALPRNAVGKIDKKALRAISAAA